VPDARLRLPAALLPAPSACASACASAVILCSSSSPIITARLSGVKPKPARPAGRDSAAAASRCGPACTQQRNMTHHTVSINVLDFEPEPAAWEMGTAMFKRQSCTTGPINILRAQDLWLARHPSTTQPTTVGCSSSCQPVGLCHHILHGLPGCCPGPHFLV
jgi:hypothetical protein